MSMSRTKKFQDWAEQQGRQHIRAILLVLMLSGAFIAGGVVLSTQINNPTAANVSYSKVWKDGSGNPISDITSATISGTVTCTITATPAFVVEIATTVGSGAYAGLNLPTPYYLKSINLDIFVHGTSTLKTSIGAVAQDSQYFAWAATFANGFTYNTDPAKCVIPTPPVASESWVINFNTLLVPNGQYDIVLRGAWGPCQATQAPQNGWNSFLNPVPPSLTSSTPVLSSFIMTIGPRSQPGFTVHISANVTSGDGANPLDVGFTSTVNGGAGSPTYLWNFGDGSDSTLANPVHTFGNGTWNVVLTVTDSLGNTATSNTITIRVGQSSADYVLFLAALGALAVAVIVYRRRQG